jgi:lipoprotein-anchoring transpeptidase ErfK/SrfK
MKYAWIIGLLVLLNLTSAAAHSNASTANDNAANEFLPDLISPEELAAELDLTQTQELAPGQRIQVMSIDDWSSLNGIDITQYFRVVVLINKANQGTLAQTAQIFFEGRPFNTYQVSTGRERMEKSPSGKVYRSTTPVGWYRPIYFSPNHFSNTWKAPMPWAVFFNGGIALHATTQSHYSELGQRASGGCVRLTYENAQELFYLIKNAGKSKVPSFSQAGLIRHDALGNIILEYNYDTLIIVENPK